MSSLTNIDENVNHIIPPGSVIGIIGGGQLGKLLCLDAYKLGYKTHILSDYNDCPASHVATYFTQTSFDDLENLQAFAENVQVVTFEFEGISLKTLEFISKFTLVRPNIKSLFITQHRIREKNFLNEFKINTAKFEPIYNLNNLIQCLKEFKEHAILKTTELGYDGKGQIVLTSKENNQEYLAKIWSNFEKREAILEEFIDFRQEVSIIVIRDIKHNVHYYPIVDNVHHNGILIKTTYPTDIPQNIQDKIKNIAKTIVDKLNFIGVLAIEFFVLEDNTVLVNEMAPRPHNSGHWTIDACYNSQFASTIQAICGLPIGTTEAHSHATMHNLIGKQIHDWLDLMQEKNNVIHIYGKTEVEPSRKMGHVTKLSRINNLK